MFSEKMLVPQHIENLQPYIEKKTIAEVRETYNPARISKLASNENRMGCGPVVSQEAASAALDGAGFSRKMIFNTCNPFRIRH
jgi:hypothetical protein